MAIPKPVDQRGEIRDERFSGAFSCFLIPQFSEDKIKIRPMDVSKRGLGFVSKEYLKLGQGYLLGISSWRFQVEVVYCGSHLGIEGLFRCGLFLREAEGDLHAICKQAGLLADSHPKALLSKT